MAARMKRMKLNRTMMRGLMRLAMEMRLKVVAESLVFIMVSDKSGR